MSESTEPDTVRGSASVPADFCYPEGTISVDQALGFMLERARSPSRGERAGLEHGLGRILAEDARAPIDVPGYDNSQMDGYAVRVDELGAAGGAFPVSQRIPAGHVPAALEPGTVARIFTGAPIPPGADAVVMQERCTRVDGAVRVPGNVSRGDNVRRAGNDVRRGERVIEAGTRLAPRHLGMLAALGCAQILVTPRLRVAIFSSGDELRMPGEALAPGEIYNSNRFTLRALLAGLGADLSDMGRVDDTEQATRGALREAAASSDVVVSSGGMSVGEEDHVKAALEAEGSLELWRVAVKPGKPLAYGRVGEADVIGLPGNPVSTLVTFCLFVRPFLLKRMGARSLHPRPWAVRADFEWSEPRRRREFARARLSFDDGDPPLARLHERQGSDVMSSTTWADGLVEIPEGTTVRRGQLVRYLGFDQLAG